MNYRKKLIEVALPLEKINVASAREKSIRHGHPSTLHLWWARRPLAACRAVLFASLVDDPDSDPQFRRADGSVDVERAAARRAELFNLIEQLVQWENSNNPTVINAARAQIAATIASRKIFDTKEWTKDQIVCREKAWDYVCRHAKPENVNDFLIAHAPPVLDPFCGRGSIPLEAQRLGLRAFGSDLNPVPVLITKALIEIPPKFANLPPVNPESNARLPGAWKGAQGLAEDVRYYGQWMRNQAEKRIGHLYPKVKVTAEMAQDRPDLKAYIGQELTVIAWIWARTVASPNPAVGGAHVPLVRSFWLSTKKGKEAWIEPIIDRENNSYQFKVRIGKPPEGVDPGKGTIVRNGGKCLVSDGPMPFEHIRAEGKAGRMRAKLLAIVAEGARGRVYLNATPEQEAAAGVALPAVYPDSDLPKQALSMRVMLYGMDKHYKLFTPRQLTALTTFSDLVKEAREKVLADALVVQASCLPSTTSILQTSCPPTSAQKFSNQPSHFVDPRKTPFVRPKFRGELPHLEKPGGTYFVTFRLADAVKMGKQKDKDLSEKAGKMPAPQGLADSRELAPEEVARECETPLTLGSCALGRDDVAAMVQDALLHFHNQHYQLHAWCIMPNHVHVVVTPLDGHELSAILHSWKSYTSKQAGKLLRSTGTFWQRESFDHLCRSRQHIQWFVRYTEENPVKAGLCVAPHDWKFSSAAHAAGNPDCDVDCGVDCGAAVPAALADQQAGCLHHKTDNQEQANNLSLDQGGTGPQAYADAVATYLALALGRITQYWSNISSWHSKGEKMQPVFGRQAIPMVWDFAECNTLSGSSGNWQGSIAWVALAIAALPCGKHGTAIQSKATTKGGTRSVVTCTDPPYYDNIGYADLSDFFYVWLRRSLSEIYPGLFKTLLTPKSEKLIATPYRHGGDKHKAQKFFETGLGEAFHRMREMQPAEYPMTVFYAFKQSEDAGEEVVGSGRDGGDGEIMAGQMPAPRSPRGKAGGEAVPQWDEERAGGTPAPQVAPQVALQSTPQAAAQVSTGWETMLAGLIDSGFAITGTWPMRTELVGNLKKNVSALASSIVLSCRPRLADASVATRREFLSALKHELPDALRYLQEGNIAPVDLAQASIGPGMALFTRYAQVMEADGSAMSVRTALGIINQMLDEVLAEQEGEFDPDTRWAVAWFEQFGTEEGPFGEAETLSRAKNTAVNGLVDAGIISARAGKVRLLKREEIVLQASSLLSKSAGKMPAPQWQIVQRLIHELETGGEQAAAGLLGQLGNAGEPARDLAYRLYNMCDRKKWAQEALAYNSLVIAWPEISRLAHSRPSTPQTQEEMF